MGLIHLKGGIVATYNGYKGCWEFRRHGRIIETCEDAELNETIANLTGGEVDEMEY